VRIEIDHRGKASVAAIARRACLWLLLLAPFFYITYGFANWLASQRQSVPNLAFAWERQIPFIAWSIVPYWSINTFYGLSLFINDRLEGIDHLAKRYLTAQVIAVCCFIAFPLTAIFTKPDTTGIPGFMFAALGGFDKPFNQAPSLHIALLVIIWDHLRRRMTGIGRSLWHAWCLLIGASVLTTYQHHSIDIPTGAMLGLSALWLFPADRPSPLAGFRWTRDHKALRLGSYYGLGALIFILLTAVGLHQSGVFLFLLWPALALALVALGYLGAGPGIFQKGTDGRITLASFWLFMPYRLGVAGNIQIWTRRFAANAEIADGVHLGRFPHRKDAAAFAAVVDMTGELAAPRHRAATDWRSFPALDLVAVPSEILHAAVDAVEDMRRNGPILICCALGMQRSATVAALWLLRTGRAKNPDDAIRLLKATGRPVHISADNLARAIEAVQ
jgi:protein-tyrosine phosphatase/membrane-associated phospholipid phosphatase